MSSMRPDFSSNSEALVPFGSTIVLAREAGCHQDCDVWATFEDLPEVVGRGCQDVSVVLDPRLSVFDNVD